MPNKVKITQSEIDDIYEIEGITGETQVNTEKKAPDSVDNQAEDTTPIFSEEETQHDENLKEVLNWNEEE